MEDKRERARKEIKSSLPAFAIGAGVGLLVTLYDTYQLISTGASLSQFSGTLCSLASGLLLIFTLLALRYEKKVALPLLLASLVVSLFRWVIIDRTFQPTISSFILLALFAWLIWRLVSWIQAKALA